MKGWNVKSQHYNYYGFFKQEDKFLKNANFEKLALLHFKLVQSVSSTYI